MSLFLSVLLAYASLSFSHITVEQGLSHNTVFSICQDKDGNMWFATINGLNRYDGYDLKVFNHDDDDPHSIGDNLINRVFLSQDGHLWIGTENGLSLYDADAEVFLNSSPGPETGITDIAEISPEKFLVITTDKNLMVFDRTSRSFSPVDHGEKSIIPTIVRRIGDTIYVGTFQRRLFGYDTASCSLQSLGVFRTNSPIVSLEQRSSTELWVGTEGDGIYLFNTLTKETRHFSSGGSERVRAMCYDLNGRLWIGGRTGLKIMDQNSFETQDAVLMPEQPDGLTYESVKCIFRDAQGGMWVGTYFGGVNYWHPLREKFRNVVPRTVDEKNANKIVGCLSMSPEGSIWIGTNSGGISIFDPKSGKTDCPEIIRKLSAIHKDDIKAIHFSPDGKKVYIGMHGSGTVIIDRGSGRTQRIPKPYDVYSITSLPDSKVLFGTLAGLYVMDPATLEMTRVPCSTKLFRIYTVFQDSGGKIWAGGKDGLNLFETGRDGTLTNITPDEFQPLRQILCIHETNEWTIWIGTMGGLWSYDRKIGRLERFQSDSPLGSTPALAIEEDSFGRLWISTYQGLFSYNPANGDIRQYTEKDGLAGRQYFNNASCRTPDGMILFGGLNGFTVFNPESIKTNTYSPQAIITGLQMNGMEVRPGDGSRILSKSISRTSRITLKHNQNSVRFRFSVQNYTAGKHNTFAYKMEGADNDWIYTTENRSTSYSHLRKGLYHLKVRVANNDGIWCPSTTQLDIRVRPIWYKTTFVEICFLLLLATVAFWSVLEAFRRQKSANEMKIRALNEEHQEEVNRMKALAYTDKASLSEAEEQFLLNALDILEANMSDPDFSVAQFASRMNMSRSNLNIRIKAVTGSAPLDLMRKHRFNEACRLLKEGNLTIAQISDRTGFSSPSYFTTSFRSQFGCTPSDFQSKK